MNEVKEAIRALAGDRADEIINHLEQGGKGAVMVSVLGELAEPQNDETGMMDEYVSLADLRAEDRKALLVKLVIGDIIGRQELGSDVLITRKAANQLTN